MAQGHGEYLASLWALLGGTDDQAAAFYTRTQEAYPLLLPAQQTTPEEMLVALATVLSSPPTMNTPRVTGPDGWTSLAVTQGILPSVK